MHISTTENKSYLAKLKISKSTHPIKSEALFNSTSFLRYSISLNSSEVITNVPVQEVSYTGTHMLYKFLSYRSTEDLSEHLSSHLVNSAYQTQKIDFFPDNLPELQIQRAYFDKTEKRLDFFVTGSWKKVVYAARNLNYSLFENFSDFSYKISKIVETEQVLVSDFMRSFIEFGENIENFDKFLLKCIEIEFQRRKKPLVTVKDGVLSFFEINSHMSSFRRVLVEISVTSGVISLKYSLNHEDFLKTEVLGSFEIKNLKKYLIQINKTLHQGFFSFQSKITFQFSYHSSLLTKENMSTIPMMQKDLDTLNLHIPQFIQILSNNFKDLEELIELGKSLKVIPRFTYKNYQSSPSSLKVLQDLKTALNMKKDFFLSNRFNHRKIQLNLKDHLVTCAVPSNFLTFAEMVNENPGLIVKSINELIEELASIGITFIKNHFPLNNFIWNEEKPVFNYEICLSEVIERKKSGISKAVGKTKRSVLKEIRKFHSKTLENDSRVFSANETRLLFENYQLIEIHKKNARALCRASQANQEAVLRKFFGICRSNEKDFLICSSGSSQPLSQFLNFLDFGQKLEVFRQLFGLVESILKKNSEINCFDLDCLVFDQFFQLKIDLKPQDFILDEFKAPEVIQGRNCRVSLIYSFGKIAEVLFGSRSEERNELKVILKVKEIVKLSTQRLVTRRLSVEGLKLLVYNAIKIYQTF